MTNENDRERELAYRFDLFIASDWSERIDALVDEHVELPDAGRLLEINCGTGAHVLATASKLNQGEAVGVDSNAELIAIASAKATAAKAENYAFAVADPAKLAYDAESFDAVILDASLARPGELRALASEAIRVARPKAPIAIAVVLRGSFDEFYSIYWEALHESGLSEELWSDLEKLVVRLPTLEEALEATALAGLVDGESHRGKEEWRFENGEAFLESPLVEDLFLGDWLAIVPEQRLDDVRAAIKAIVDRESEGAYFDVSAKTLLVVGTRERAQ
jgi:ubiquinone/menaquinone biosynthesis C-methylase UbiE